MVWRQVNTFDITNLIQEHVIFQSLINVTSSFVGEVEIGAGFSSYFIQNNIEVEETSKTVWEFPTDEEDIEISDNQSFRLDTEEDLILFPDNFDKAIEEEEFIFTAYKRVDKKVNPISGTFPEEAQVERHIP